MKRNELPPFCFTTLRETGELVLIKRYEKGYFKTDYDSDDRKKNKEMEEFLNRKHGVTPVQKEALHCGSLFGWKGSFTNPQDYMDKAVLDKTERICGHIKDPVMSAMYPVKGNLYQYYVAGYKMCYEELVRSLGGEVIRFSPDTKNYINPLDMSRDYGEGDNPLSLKSNFVMSLYENLNNGRVDSGANSLVDRCMKNIYQEYLKDYDGEPPTLKELRQELLRQEEPLAKQIALTLELFTEGSSNVFSHQTNVNQHNRIICYDILDLGKSLKTIGMLIMLDSILNRVMENRKNGKRTWVYIDEIYLFFANEYSSTFLSESWKRFRKYGALATGITQNVSDCLRSDMAKTMFSNSEFLILLNQSANDRKELGRLFHISDTQMNHITDTQAGRGLLKVKSSLVPFINEFPKDTELYRLMTTKPEDR